MKNLLTLKEEKLEELPKWQVRDPRPKAAHSYSRRGKWWGSYPYGKVENFLKSSRGKPLDEVFSKYCKLEWLPKEFRNREWFSKNICLNTEMRDGTVWFQNEYGGIFQPLDQNIYRTDVYYIHPEKRTVEYWHHSQEDWKVKQARETAKMCRILGDYHQLLKLDGIWHEVKAVPEKTKVFEIDGLHWKLTNKKPSYYTRICVYNGKVISEISDPPGVEGKDYRIIDGYIAYPYVYHPPGYYERKPCGPKDVMITNGDKWGYKPTLHWSWKRGIIIVSCKQAGHKTLKKYGLKNDPKVYGPRCKKCGGIAGKTCLYHICSKCKKYLREDCKCNGW